MTRQSELLVWRRMPPEQRRCLIAQLGHLGWASGRDDTSPTNRTKESERSSLNPEQRPSGATGAPDGLHHAWWNPGWLEQNAKPRMTAIAEKPRVVQTDSSPSGTATA